MSLSNVELEVLFHRGITVEEHEIIVSTVVGRHSYVIPVGNWFIDRASDTSLDIDTGGGWIPQAYGADYSHLRRYSPPASVADLCIGWSLAGPPPAGWSMRFRWKQWNFRDAPKVVAPVRLVAGAGSDPDYSKTWHQNMAGDEPDAVQVSELDGFGLEFWRRTLRTGGLRGLTLKRSGRRYVPYQRFPAGQFIVHKTEFSPCTSASRHYYRVCYYDPATGARSPLSREVVTVNNFRDDRLRTIIGGGVVRVSGSVWVTT